MFDACDLLMKQVDHAKIRCNSNSSLLNIYNLPSQIYAQAKFQPDMPNNFRSYGPTKW